MQTNLISDIPGVARITDPNLVNPWGQSASAGSPLWVSNEGSNTSTLYTGAIEGSIPKISSLVVTIPGGKPTGTVFNGTKGFVVHTGNRERSGELPVRFGDGSDHRLERRRLRDRRPNRVPEQEG